MGLAGSGVRDKKHRCNVHVCTGASESGITLCTETHSTAGVTVPSLGRDLLGWPLPPSQPVTPGEAQAEPQRHGFRRLRFTEAGEIQEAV